MRAINRTLTEDELHAFWRRLDGVKLEPIRAAIKLALLMGGQRPAQLLRLRRADVDLRAGRLMLYDAKGARHEPRVHELPITDAARAVLEPMMERSATLGSEWVFTSSGNAQIFPGTLTKEVRDISAAMVDAREAAEAFSLRDLRRTVETTLASLQVSQDVRAQIQSHGLSGIQHKHYNRHDYRPEKRAVLAMWEQWLTTTPTGRVITGQFRHARLVSQCARRSTGVTPSVRMNRAAAQCETQGGQRIR